MCGEERQCVCVGVCVCVRERERERERDVVFITSQPLMVGEKFRLEKRKKYDFVERMMKFLMVLITGDHCFEVLDGSS